MLFLMPQPLRLALQLWRERQVLGVFLGSRLLEDQLRDKEDVVARRHLVRIYMQAVEVVGLLVLQVHLVEAAGLGGLPVERADLEQMLLVVLHLLLVLLGGLVLLAIHSIQDTL